MRLIHLGDTHLGFRQFTRRLDTQRQMNQREADVYRSWHAAIDFAIERGVDVVVHAGDLFDSPRPTPRAVAEALDGFERLDGAGIPVVLIAGNHSTPRSRTGGSVFEILDRYPGVHAAWDGPARFDLAGTSFHAIPHEPDPNRLAAAIAGIVPGPGRNVLIAHGGLDTAAATYCEAGGVDIDAETIATSPVDYVALGHLHAFQVVQENAAYCGSLERLDFADTVDKVVVEVDLEAAGTRGFLQTHPVAARPVFTIDIPCSGCAPHEVIARLEAEADRHAIGGAVIRVRLEGLARDAYQALDVARIDEILAPALHHVLAVGDGGLRSGDGAPAPGEIDFDAFVRDRVPEGVDADRVLALAHRFLNEAGAAEAEEAASA